MVFVPRNDPVSVNFPVGENSISNYYILLPTNFRTFVRNFQFTGQFSAASLPLFFIRSSEKGETHKGNGTIMFRQWNDPNSTFKCSPTRNLSIKIYPYINYAHKNRTKKRYSKTARSMNRFAFIASSTWPLRDKRTHNAYAKL